MTASKRSTRSPAAAPTVATMAAVFPTFESAILPRVFVDAADSVFAAQDVATKSKVGFADHCKKVGIISWMLRSPRTKVAKAAGHGADTEVLLRAGPRKPQYEVPLGALYDEMVAYATARCSQEEQDWIATPVKSVADADKEAYRYACQQPTSRLRDLRLALERAEGAGKKQDRGPQVVRPARQRFYEEAKKLHEFGGKLEDADFSVRKVQGWLENIMEETK